MMGRAVLVLCMLAGTALACPDYDGLGESQRASVEVDAAGARGDDTHGLAVAVALLGLCGFAFAITRANAVRRTFATSRHHVESRLEIAQAVAQIGRRRVVVFLVGCTLAQGGVAMLPIDPLARAILGVAPMLLFAAGLVALWRLQRVLALRPDPAVRITAHGGYLFASHRSHFVGWVAASPSLLARASGLPSARLRQ